MHNDMQIAHYSLVIVCVFSPAVLFSLLTLASILFMGLGRYHGQTKAIIALRKPPAVELLDPEQQELVRNTYEEVMSLDIIFI